MARRRSPRAQSLAQVVEELGLAEPGSGQSTPIVNLAAQPTFTDRSGVVWTRQGGPIPDKRVRKLMHDLSVRVLHDYLGEVREVPAEEREAFWESAQELMRQSSYSQFTCSEFKDKEQAHLLVVHEDC